MSNLVPSGDSNENSNQIVLGDDSSSQAISFKLAQAFYGELTGRSERLVEEYNKAFILTLENIKQLDHRLNQLLVQYNIVSVNSYFSVKYQLGSSERFSSIDRLCLHAGSNGLAVEEIVVSYNLLIILPELKKPQEYKINVRLYSRVVKVERVRNELEGIVHQLPLWFFERENNCIVSIDFIDVSVAHSFMSTIKKWFDGLNTTPQNKVFNKIKLMSKFYPACIAYTFLFLATYLIFSNVENFFIESTNKMTAEFMLSSMLCGFLAYNFGFFLGKRSQVYLDEVYDLSYIEFSNSDKIFVSNCKSTVRNSFIKSLSCMIATILLGVLSSLLSSFILK